MSIQEYAILFHVLFTCEFILRKCFNRYCEQQHLISVSVKYVNLEVESRKME